jgi:hypothetical protein
MRTHSGSASVTARSTSRAVVYDNITPPGGATDSIRCAIPTCSPNDPEPISPAITRPEFRPTRTRSATPFAAGHQRRQPVGLLLDGQGGQAPPKSVILQRNRGAESRHHTVRR